MIYKYTPPVRRRRYKAIERAYLLQSAARNSYEKQEIKAKECKKEVGDSRSVTST